MIIKSVESSLNKVCIIGTEHSDSIEQVNKLKEIVSSFYPDIVLIEGNFSNASFNSEKEAVEKGGEMGYLVFLCNNKGITLSSNDPPDDEIFEFVKENYGEKTARRYFNLRKDERYKDYFNPLLYVHNFNKITRELNKFRDKYMLDKIKEKVKIYKRIMVVKGEEHIKDNYEHIKEAVENV